jgi:NitT/TauT family transport system permease protein
MTDAERSILVRRGTIASLILLVLFLAAWEWGPGLLNVPTFIVPPLSMVYKEFIRMWGVSALPFWAACSA